MKPVLEATPSRFAPGREAAADGIRPRAIASPALATPLFATLGVSAACVALYGVRVWWAGNWAHLYLVWNLFLAWVPLGLALATRRAVMRPAVRRGTCVALGLAWFGFFPNAPYIFTDLVHLAWRRPPVFWVDLMLILLFALTGLLLGFLSLYVMQSLVARRFGRMAGWLFVSVAAAMAGLGVYIGRFLRWNSWDAVLSPVDLARDLAGSTVQLRADLRPAVVAAMFGVFVWLSYVLLYSLTHLRPAPAEGVEAPRAVTDGIPAACSPPPRPVSAPARCASLPPGAG